MQHEEWILLAAASSGDVGLDIEQQLSRPDQFSISIFIGIAEIGFNVNQLDWIGQWLGMLELEMGRSIEMESHIQLIRGTLSLLREDEPGHFIIRLSCPDHDASIELAGQQKRLLCAALRDALQQLAVA